MPALARAIAAATVLLALLVPALAVGQQPPSESPVAAARDTEPVVLTGSQLPDWSARSNFTARLPLMDLAECSEATNPDREFSREHCHHNQYAKPEVDTADRQPKGPHISRILGYRWNGKRFVQIPFQVDEVFARYLHNSISGFAHYSGEDQHTTYEFDREGWRFAAEDPDNPCLARPLDDDGNPATPAPVTTQDPVDGLDDNDELAFMASDAGEQPAPGDAPLPRGIESARQVVVTDPANGKARYAYVMLADQSPEAPKPEFTRENGYVDYRRDANADIYEKSESSYEDYGNARRGVYCDAAGNIVRKSNGTPDVQRRRPRDYAWIQTPRYRFRYDGRWLMTQIRVSADGGETYGPDLVDRWKARAYQQDPASETPCCGYEEEDTNWGGSSTLLGERTGPVRAIRETWGADSGTNVVRRETFYREEMRQKTWLRVHPITPVDGIYAQWDFNAGVMKTFYNPRNSKGVEVDGSNDEAFGNFDDPCNRNYDGNDTSDFDQGYRSAYRASPLCHERMPYHQSIDNTDPTFNDPNAGLTWSQTSGPDGTIVDRYEIDRITDVTPGGAPHAVVAVPYYRDDSCFDDGTGSDPGPKVNLRSGNEPRTWFNPATGQNEPRECWEPSDGIPDGSQRFFQGSIATHGLHLLFIVDSDNARLTVPTTEIVSQHRLVMLPGNPGNVGERYGRGLEKPMAALAAPFAGSEGDGPGEPGDGGENPGGGNGNGGGGNPGGGNGNAGSGGGGNPGGGNGNAGSGAGGSSLRGLVVRALAPRRAAARRGAFTVRCLVPAGRTRSCAVSALAGRRVVGRGAAPARGRAVVPVRVRLTRTGRALAARSHGVPLRLVFSALGTDGSRARATRATRAFARS